MRNFTTYRDSVTGYEIRQYTQGQERNTKLYFTTENFTTDDRYFFFNQQIPSGLKNEVYQGTGDLYKAEVESGELKLVAGSEYSGFAMDRFENYGVLTKGMSFAAMNATAIKSLNWVRSPLAVILRGI